jgi:hypothetical protein
MILLDKNWNRGGYYYNSYDRTYNFIDTIKISIDLFKKLGDKIPFGYATYLSAQQFNNLTNEKEF